MKSKKTLMIISFVALLVLSSVLVFVSFSKPKDEDPQDDEDLIIANEMEYDIVDTALRSMIVNGATDPLLLATPQERFDLIDFDARFFRPVLDTKVSLYVASLPSKPSTPASGRLQNKPLISSPKTSSYQQSAFIDRATSPIRWFSLVKDNGISPSKYIWQVSISPYDGKASDPLNAKGVLSFGEVSADATEFSIDFSKALTVKSLAVRFGLSEDRLKRIYLPSLTKMGSVPNQKTYYVRILAVDAEGKVIGDGGSGIPILYGDPITLPINTILLDLNARFDLLSTRVQGLPSFGVEFANDFDAIYNKTISSSSSDLSYHFLPSDFPSSATSLVLQVTKTPFSGSSWNTVPGLVYEIRINMGETAFDALDKYNSLKIDFAAFAPANSTLADDQFITYYVRAVALTPTDRDGLMSAKVSKMVTIKYGRSTAVPVIYDKVQVNPRIPDVVAFSYTPIQWETPNWQYHYVVTRQPLESEIFLGFGSDKPYGPFTVGTKLDFTPQPNDDSWWDEVKGAISSFFSDMVGYLAKITNWVSSTYANLKTGLVKLATDLLPVPQEWRDKLAIVLEGVVDYGLASMGIPPTLPNFDDLTNLGTDYLATMALESAGIPPEDILKDGLSELSEGIVDSVNTSVSQAAPNPMNWDFVRLDPDYMYRPAYVLITLHNPYDVATPEGTLSGYNEYIINTKAMSTSEQSLYARFGGNVYYSTFKVVSGQKVPALAPNQTLVIPVFLEEMTGKSYWTNGPLVDQGEFGMIYFTLGEFYFNFTINYELPNAYETELAQNPNAPKDAIYSYTKTGSTISWKAWPTDPFTWD